MTSQKTAKLNQLFQRWPKGTVATQTWLNQLGISSKLANWHVGSGWLNRFGARAFKQPGDQVGWQGGLYALQTQLKMTVHIGGRTALELQGRSHFVPLGPQKKVLLVSDQPEQLPAWFRNHPWNEILQHRCLSLFERVLNESFTMLDCGGFKVIMSNTERAILEQMHLVKSNADIEHAYKLMEGLSTLRPNVVQVLLENCRSAKAKRLFLWSAQTAGHIWFMNLNSARINLGKGKRQIYKGGQFNQRYMITVPKPEEPPGV